MTTNTVAHHLLAWLHGRGAGQGSDESLLNRFLAGDDAAFEALLRRHGPAVLAVCRRLLGHAQDAEDAFQATFLVLFRKASTVRPRDQLAGWLLGVAHRTARQAWRQAARRRAREEAAAAGRPTEAWPKPGDEAAVLEEVGRLPPAYRTVVTLCDLEGKPRREAAEQLGWPEGTVAGRLARARDLLRRRLASRGIDAAPAAWAAAVPPALLRSTQDALTPGGPLSAEVASLAKEVCWMMSMNRLKNGLVALLVCCAVAAGLGVSAVAQEDRPPPAATRAEPPKDVARPLTLPTGPAPEQALAIVTAEGQIAVRRNRSVYTPITTARADGRVVTTYSAEHRLQVDMFPLKEVSAHDTDGRKVDQKQLRKRLAKELLVLSAVDGKPVDRLYLRLVKPGTLILVLPLPAPQTTPVPAVAPVKPPPPPLVPQADQPTPPQPPAVPPPLSPDSSPPVQQAVPPPPDKGVP